MDRIQSLGRYFLSISNLHTIFGIDSTFWNLAGRFFQCSPLQSFYFQIFVRIGEGPFPIFLKFYISNCYPCWEYLVFTVHLSWHAFLWRLQRTLDYDKCFLVSL